MHFHLLVIQDIFDMHSTHPDQFLAIGAVFDRTMLGLTPPTLCLTTPDTRY